MDQHRISLQCLILNIIMRTKLSQNNNLKAEPAKLRSALFGEGKVILTKAANVLYNFTNNNTGENWRGFLMVHMQDADRTKVASISVYTSIRCTQILCHLAQN